MHNLINDKFARMGARARLSEGAGDSVRIDVRHDDHGEFFDLRFGPGVRLTVLDVRPNDRHLLLMARAGDADRGKFLCGHDERHWFVASVPETSATHDVQSARDALKPPEVWEAIRQFGVRLVDRDRRRTGAFVRQGEWFFIPEPGLKVDPRLILRSEPMRRGRGKPHQCQELYRVGGEQVWVSSAFSNGLSLAAYRAMPEHRRRKHLWRPMVRDARVYVRGAVRHPDHKTVRLANWHRVLMNTETQAAAMRHVAFLD